jgi:DNA-binding NtrC family response regulator
VIERAIILSGSEFIEAKHLPPDLSGERPARMPKEGLAPGMRVDEVERRLIELTLVHTRNNKTRAAEILGITTKTLQNKLKRFGDDDRDEEASS